MNRAVEQNTFKPPSAPLPEVDFFAVATLLWRGKVWIFLATLLGVCASGYYGFRVAIPLYPASVTIALEPDGQGQIIGEIESIFGGGGTDTTAINTEIEVLRSRDLMERLVDELDLTQDLEFNGLEDGPGPVARVRMALTDWVPVPMTDEARRNYVANVMASRISVVNVRQSLAFDISIETRDPQKSADIMNALANIYIENSIRRKLNDATRAVQFLSERTTELRASFEDLQQDLARRVEASNVIDATVLQAQSLQLRDLRERAEEARGVMAEQQALLDGLASTNDASALIELAEQSGEGRFTTIVQRFRRGTIGETDAARAVIEAANDLRDDMDRTGMQLQSLEDSASELSQQLGQQSEELVEIQQLERELEAAQLLYETFLTRLQEASVQRGLETADSRVLSRAIPMSRSSPRVMVIMALGGICAALLSMILVLMREWKFAGFRTIDDLRMASTSPVLGSVPVMAVRTRKKVLEHLKSKTNSVFAEAVRNLRTSILMTNPDREPQVILVTSSVPGEGKTTLSLALAQYFGSLEDRRVILVEADIRRQTLRAYVNNRQPRGVQLLDLILGKTNFEGADLYNSDFGVEVLLGSDGDFNAADLFESRRFRDLMTKLRDQYDHIIIDSPPVLAVPDARVLTRYADVSVFAVRWSSTTRMQLRQGLEMLKSVGFPATGLVMTQVNQRKMKGYGYGGQYGYDGYSSGYYVKG